MVAAKAPTANSANSQRGTRPRNGLMVLMVLMVLIVTHQTKKRKITTTNLYFLLSSCIFGKKFITLRVEVATRRATHIQQELMR